MNSKALVRSLPVSCRSSRATELPPQAPSAINKDRASAIAPSKASKMACQPRRSLRGPKEASALPVTIATTAVSTLMSSYSPAL
jgi:hypothetical protein